MDTVGKDADYSQYGEQPIILNYFQDHPDAPQYCVDAGAYEGTIGSNSRALFLRGWAGLAIEPDPRSFARLDALYRDRPEIFRLRRALSNRPGIRLMRFCKGPAGTRPEDEWKFAQVNTFSGRFADEYVREHKYRYRRSFVVATTLMQALKTARAPEQIGFMSIDCETEDFNIIASTDFARYRPWLLCVECAESDNDARSRIETVLSPHGYRYHAQTFANAFFALH